MLVFIGDNSVNYAVIPIALSLKCQVFVVADTNDQLEVIKTNYPEVSDRFDLKSDRFLRKYVLRSNN